MVALKLKSISIVQFLMSKDIDLFAKTSIDLVMFPCRTHQRRRQDDTSTALTKHLSYPVHLKECNSSSLHCVAAKSNNMCCFDLILASGCDPTSFIRHLLMLLQAAPSHQPCLRYQRQWCKRNKSSSLVCNKPQQSINSKDDY